ncbi:hypothetical protein DRQ53_02565 [bacterium]|nr:MAG: hypothetical protein DRQ53_02565 [bacterium]
MRRKLSRGLILSLVLAAAVVAGCQDAFVSSGILYQEQDKWAKAEQMFKTAIWRNDQNADAHYQLAFTYAYRVEYEHLERDEVDSAKIKTAGAYEHYLLAAELKPDKYRFNPEEQDETLATPSDTGIRSMYARLFNEGVRAQADDSEKAMLYFELAALADPRDEAGFDATLLVYQLQYTESREDDDAVRELIMHTDELEVGDDWPDANEKRTALVEFQATMYRTLGQDAMAGQLYESLLASDPDNIKLIQSVASTRERQRDFAGAADLYERAFNVAEASPLDHRVEDRYALVRFAAEASMNGELYERAIDYCDQAMSLATSNVQRSDVARTSGWANFELEQYDEVVTVIEPVLLDGGYDTTSADGWNLYRQALIRLGRIDEASQAKDRYDALQGGR